jgi:hypothetical protein
MIAVRSCAVRGPRDIGVITEAFVPYGHLPVRRNPTPLEISVLLDVIAHGGHKAAARETRRKLRTVHNTMRRLRYSVGARSDVETVRIVWPIIRDHVWLPGDPPPDRRVARLTDRRSR